MQRFPTNAIGKNDAGHHEVNTRWIFQFHSRDNKKSQGAERHKKKSEDGKDLINPDKSGL
jgi:hypothetical protein